MAGCRHALHRSDRCAGRPGGVVVTGPSSRSAPALAPPDRPVPVTVVCGWWGDGPAAVVRRLARAVPGLVVIRSAFAPAGDALAATGAEVVVAEAEVARRCPRCVSCAVRLDLVVALRAIARRRRLPAHVVVEPAGDADAATIAQTLLDHPELRRLVRLDGIVTVLDGPRLATAVATTGGGPIWPAPTAHDQVLLADRLVVHGGERLTEQGASLAGATARAANPSAAIDLDATTAEPAALLNLRAWELARIPGILGRAGMPTVTQAHPAGPNPACRQVLLGAVGVLDPDMVEEWVADLHRRSGRRLLRLDAELAIHGDEHAWVATGVRTTVVTGAGPPRRVPRPLNRVRLVGHDLDAEDLAAGLSACVEA